MARSAIAAPRRVAVGKVAKTSLPGDREFDFDRISRALSGVQSLAQQAADSRFTFTEEIEIDLIVGTNHIAHGLGRRPRGMMVTPRDADATFAWGFDWRQQGNTRPDRIADVVVVGVAMTVRIVFY